MGRSLSTVLAVAALAAASTPDVGRAETAARPARGAAEKSLGQLREALIRGEPVAAALRRVPSFADDRLARLRHHLVAAEAAYQRGDAATARELLQAVPRGLSFASAYASYLLGLLTLASDPAAAHSHFAAAFESAGDTLLRQRAGLWLAEGLRQRGDLEGAASLLRDLSAFESVPALVADLTVRQGLLLEALGRHEAAFDLIGSLYLDLPLLAFDRDTELLARVVRASLEPTLDRLPFAGRMARARAILDAGHPREARAEAAELVSGGRGSDRDAANLLLARAELALRSPRTALRALAAVSPERRGQAEALGLTARAQRQLGRHAEADKILARLAQDPGAGETRFEAAEALARRLEDKDPSRALPYWQIVAESHQSARGQDANWRLGWERYRGTDPADAVRRFARLAIAAAGDRTSAARASYWTGRSLEKTGKLEAAVALYRDVQALAPEGYYGIASGDRLKALTGPATAIGRGADARAADPLVSSPRPLLDSLAAGRELVLLGFADDAVSELKYQCQRYPEAEAPRLLLADSFHGRGEYMESVRWVKRAFPQHDLTALPEGYGSRLYPLPFWDTIRQNAERHGLDPYLVAAIIYQESRFTQNARSAAGAIGLMQIMPATGREIARRLGEAPPSAAASLEDPERNIRYGTWYFQRMLETHGGNVIFALAGYNAGSGRVKRWLGQGVGDIDEFIESIPFRETRNYVKQILVAREGYRQVYGRTLADGGAP